MDGTIVGTPGTPLAPVYGRHPFPSDPRARSLVVAADAILDSFPDEPDPDPYPDMYEGDEPGADVTVRYVYDGHPDPVADAHERALVAVLSDLSRDPVTGRRGADIPNTANAERVLASRAVDRDRDMADRAEHPIRPYWHVSADGTWTWTVPTRRGQPRKTTIGRAMTGAERTRRSRHASAGRCPNGCTLGCNVTTDATTTLTATERAHGKRAVAGAMM